MRMDDWQNFLKQNQKAEERINGIEYEGDSDIEDSEYDYPYRSEDIRIEQKMFSLFQICRWIKQGNLLLRPEFQRNFVWNQKKQSLLIESLMLKIPIPAFYFDEDENGGRTVIDGMQRLTTIYNFMQGEFELRGLQYLQDCEGLKFADLEGRYQYRIEETQLAVNILDARCPKMVKFDVFRRINTGGVPLNPQEVRNIMATDATRKLLRNMASSKEFILATHERVRDVRMGAQELCLRFITYNSLYDKDNLCFSSFGEMTHLLDRMIIELNQMEQNKLYNIYHGFLESMQKCYALFGEMAFSKPNKKNIINRALFTSFGILLADCEWEEARLRECRERAITLLELFLDENVEYYNSITSSTSSRHNMEIQFYYAYRILEELE